MNSIAPVPPDLVQDQFSTTIERFLKPKGSSLFQEIPRVFGRIFIVLDSKRHLTAIKATFPTSDMIDVTPLREAKFLELLKSGQKNPVIINIIEEFYLSRSIHCISLPHYEFNLADFLKARKEQRELSVEEIKTIAHRMLEALKILKDHRVIHGNINAQNFVLNCASDICLIDFKNAFRINEPNCQPIPSPYEQSPEVVMRAVPYSYAIDLWSFACVLAQIWNINHQTPQYIAEQELERTYSLVNNNLLRLRAQAYLLGNKELLETKFFKTHPDLQSELTGKWYKGPMIDDILLDGPLQLKKTEMSRNISDLIKQILLIDPKKRLTVEQALRHHFFTWIPPQKETAAAASPSLLRFPSLIQAKQNQDQLSIKMPFSQSTSFFPSLSQDRSAASAGSSSHSKKHTFRHPINPNLLQLEG